MSLLDKFVDVSLEQTKKYSEECDKARDACFESKRKLEEGIIKYRVLYYGIPIAAFLIVFMIIMALPRQSSKSNPPIVNSGFGRRSSGISSRRRRTNNSVSSSNAGKGSTALILGFFAGIFTYIAVRQAFIFKYAPMYNYNCTKYRHIPFCAPFNNSNI